jgi:hypothetical protein
MKLSHRAHRRLLLIYAASLALVALALTIGVIDPVEVEASIGATRAIAVTAFWVIAGLNVLFAAILVIIAARLKTQTCDVTPVHAIGGIIVILLGIMLADAASAYQSHGPSMQTASLILVFCATADFLTGVMMVITAFIQPKKV